MSLLIFKHLTTRQRIDFLFRIVAMAWIACKLLSFNLWLDERVYPTIPLFSNLDGLPSSVDIFLYSFSLVILVFIVMGKISKVLTVILVVVELYSCILDMSRWQPWEFMYLSFFSIYILYSKNSSKIFRIIHVFLIGMYVYAGLHKLNRDFLDGVWLNMILQKSFGMSIGVVLKYKLYFIGLVVPLIELIFGIGLGVIRNKLSIAFGLIFMHFLILCLLGPLGLNYNSVVWPWNISIIFVLYFIYVSEEWNNNQMVFSQFILAKILWWVMPGFSLIGYWFQSLSFNLYSGKGNEVYVCFKTLPPDLERINVKNYVLQNKCDGKLVSLHDWSMSELNVPSVAESQIIELLKNKIESKYSDYGITFIESKDLKRSY